MQQQLTFDSPPAVLAEAAHDAGMELREWGVLTSGYYQRKADQVKELILVLAQASGSVTQRDHKYTEQFNAFTTRLQDISNLEDLSRLRHSLVASVLELKQTAEEMSRDGQQMVNHLNAKLSTYRDRLKEVEKIAAIDPLTGLPNRRKIELTLGENVRRGRPFRILMVDLDHFKLVNDRYGHAAGDELLKQFAKQLQLAVRSSDLAGRWGGDEFLVVLDCLAEQSSRLLRRVQEGVVGEYTLHCPSGSPTIRVSAAVGVATWIPGESITETIARADRVMYRGKSHRNGD